MRALLKNDKWMTQQFLCQEIRRAGELLVQLRKVDTSYGGFLSVLNQPCADFGNWHRAFVKKLKEHVAESALVLDIEFTFDLHFIQDKTTPNMAVQAAVVRSAEKALGKIIALARAVESEPETAEMLEAIRTLGEQADEWQLVILKRLDLTHDQLGEANAALKRQDAQLEELFLEFASSELKPKLQQYVAKFGPRGLLALVNGVT